MSTTRSTKKNESRSDSTSDDSVTVGDIEGIVAKAVKAAVQVVREEFQKCFDVIFFLSLWTVSCYVCVRIYVRNSHAYYIIDEFKISSVNECPVENLWIKVTKGCNKYIIGAIYRHPGYKIEICNKLNNYFCSVGAKLAQSLSSGSNNDFIKYLPFPNKIACSVAQSPQMK